jgi:hypothetical protein
MVPFIHSRRLAVTVIFTLIMAMLLVTSSPHTSPPVQAYNPQITVSPEQGPAGTQVTVTGTGWEEHASRGISVPIEIGFANEVARGYPDANGKFSVSLTIPTEAEVGELELLAIIGNGGSADATFTVSPPVTGAYSVIMEGAFTAEPDPPGQGTYSREKTTFHPGGTIWYMGAVRNSGQEPVDAYFTWRGKYDDPEIGVEIFSDKNTVTLQPGYVGYYSPGIIPSDAAGPYLNRVTVVVGTDKFVKESRFEIAGGEACMFNAPDFSLDSNHVGWGFKTGLGDEWEYGATEGTSTSDNWIKKGTRAEMLAEFGSQPHYTRYTCRPWPWIWSNPSAADKEARDGQARPYDAYRDNDLSRAVAVLNRAYGAGMPYLDLVEFLNANYYFESLPTEQEGGAPTRWTAIKLLNPVTEVTPTPPAPKPVPTPTPAPTPTPTPTPPCEVTSCVRKATADEQDHLTNIRRAFSAERVQGTGACINQTDSDWEVRYNINDPAWKISPGELSERIRFTAESWRVSPTNNRAQAQYSPPTEIALCLDGLGVSRDDMLETLVGLLPP